MENGKRGGQNRKTCALNRRIKVLIRNNPRITANQILRDLRDKSISLRTIQRRLVEVVLSGSRPAKKPCLSKKNREAS